jgi:hypothetical protein
MNTANLQLEGLLLGLASLVELLERKGIASRDELDATLAAAEGNASRDPGRPTELSAANVDAICFPIRFLRAALREPDRDKTFAQVATAVGQNRKADPNRVAPD